MVQQVPAHQCPRLAARRQSLSAHERGVFFLNQAPLCLCTAMGVPTGPQPAIPALQPAIPALQPAIPALQPVVPALQPAIPAQQPAIPALQPAIPAL